jgi:4-methoxybenzoate monooxygenase (O-demethylating)
MMGAAPVLDVDPFADDFLREPDAHHEQLREVGPVVFLERYGVWAMARFAEVRAALRDHETFCSSAGVGLSDFRKETPWRPPSLLLEADPPQHTRTRRATANVMSPRAIERFRADFEHEAEVMVTDLVARGSFNGVTALAQAYPLRVFPDAVGLSRDGRENLLAYGGMVFNAFGPRNRLFVEAMAAAEPVRTWIADHCKRDALAPDGLGAHLYQAADAGDVTVDEAGMLARSLLSAGIDTSKNALALALHALAARPDQWAALRDDPALARTAFEETLRFASPVQTFFRTTTRDVEVGGTTIPDGEKVLLFLGAANRDPRHWQDPDRFDITRHNVGHVGFGTGIHACVGAGIARLEAEILLKTMTRHVRSLELSGPARPLLNNTLRGLTTLPMLVHPA